MNKNGSLVAPEILVVDDEIDIRELMAGILADEGYETRVASDSDGTLAAITNRRPHLVVLDVWLQGSRLDGIQVLDVLKREHPDLPVVIISGHGTIETAVAAIKKGAYDFIEKPFKADRLIHVVRRALEAARLKREVEELKLKAGDETELVGQFYGHLASCASWSTRSRRRGSRILITGPSGSGKEVAARLIHALSRRAGNAFVAVNCAMMAPSRIETELFGVENEGGRKIGLLEIAHGGTLFLDEVADMPLETQGKILRVLIDQTFQRIGGATRVQVDVRVISSSTRDLRQEIEAGPFPRGSLSPAERGAGARAVARRTPRRRSCAGRSFHEAAVDRVGSADARDRRRSHGGAAGLSLAGQCAPAAEYRGAAADPRHRRRCRSDLGRSAARRISTAAPRPGRKAPSPTSSYRCLCAKRVRFSSATICSRRSTALAATSRARHRSSAWSARRCIAS